MFSFVYLHAPWQLRSTANKVINLSLAHQWTDDTICSELSSGGLWRIDHASQPLLVSADMMDAGVAGKNFIPRSKRSAGTSPLPKSSDTHIHDHVKLEWRHYLSASVGISHWLLLRINPSNFIDSLLAGTREAEPVTHCLR